jgi:3-deoxy-D-manno-octulosonic acid hydroxylase-like protein
MAELFQVERSGWSGRSSTEPDVTHVLEAGGVVYLPNLRFAVNADEMIVFTPDILGSAKNASFDPSTGRLGGTKAAGNDAVALRSLLQRFSDAALALVCASCPRYESSVERKRTSFRPAEIAGRRTAWRKDDTRLHVDSFPATPCAGRRILRVFSNVNPDGRARAWRVGGEFESVARRFAADLHLPWPGTSQMLRLLRITKTTRTPYDALMLQLHDRMKADAEFQDHTPQTAFDFPAGSTWIAFTDQVSHAAMAGQYQLEQTFLLPVDAMADPDRSPLRVLERMTGRRLT